MALIETDHTLCSWLDLADSVLIIKIGKDDGASKMADDDKIFDCCVTPEFKRALFEWCSRHIFTTWSQLAGKLDGLMILAAKPCANSKTLHSIYDAVGQFADM